MWPKVESLLLKHDKNDEQIEKTLPWFFETVKCFHQVRQEDVNQIIRKSEYDKIKKDHVIIRQGEIGDSCYIILKGTVSIYVKRHEESHEHFEETSSRVTVFKTHKDRSRFGIEVSVLRQGDKFGDLCFYNSNYERNATALSDDDVSLLVIDRQTYQTHLSDLFHDLNDQLSFMRKSTLFKGFPYDYRITLLEKFKTRRYHYGNAVVRQGDPVTSMYIICRGEALLKVNPLKLSKQYNLPAGDSIGSPGPLTVIQKRRKIIKEGYETAEELEKRKNITVSTIGVNQIFGDIEFALNLETYHVTAVCQSTMLVMEVDNAEMHRIILRRDSKITDIINNNVLSKLAARAKRCAKVPQYRELHKMAAKLTERLPAGAAVAKTKPEGARRHTIVDVANVFKMTNRLAGAGKLRPKGEQRPAGIVGALKKTIAGALESTGGKGAGKSEVTGEGTGQDDTTAITALRKMKGKTRKDGQQQDKEKKQFTVKEYRALKKKMQAAGKTITPLD